MHPRPPRPARVLAALLIGALVTTPSAAAPPSREQEARAAVDAARAALVAGPARVPLADQAILALPANYGFIPQRQAAALMSAMGNRTGKDFLGLVVPRGADQNWFVAVVYEPAGYIKDDDARHWDAGELLKSLRDGTEAANAERAKAGIAPLEVTRWIEPPAYDARTHRLAWAAEARVKGSADTDPTVNTNTYLLGREGYVSLNLVTRAASVETDRNAAHELLAAVEFNPGKRYADFNSATDKVAAYGLAALVAGVAAKKLGLLALLAATFLKFAKVIAIAGAAAVTAATRWLRRRGRTPS